MLTKNFIQFFFLSAITLVIGACVPKATEKKADCGSGQSFNSITRNCYSIVKSKSKPIATLSSSTLTQEVAKTLTLSYTDADNDKVTTCKVSDISSNIEMISPQVTSGNIFAKADLVYNSARDLASALPSSFVADKTSLNTQRDNIQNTIASARATYTYANLQTLLGLVATYTNNALTTASTYKATYSSVKYYSDLLTTRLADFNAAKTFVDNHCDCSAGVCTTIVAPRMMQNGAAGFSYTLTDVDGESNSKIVALSITAISSSTNYLAPAVESNYVTFSESATSTASSYSFTLPSARDYFGSASFSYTFSGSKNGSNYGLTTSGKVSACMDLVGSSGPTDTTCLYTPNSGDTYDSIAPAKATATIGDLVFTAKKEGSFANNYTIEYFDLADYTSSENFGLVSQTYTNSFVRVVGNDIEVFLVKGSTSSADIKNLLNADMKAKTMLTVTGGSSSTYPDPATLTPSSVALSGGTDAFDKISYTVSNGYASSSNTATVMVKMTATEDAPVYNSVASRSVTALEDSGQITIDLSPTYSDVENNVDACDVDAIQSAIFVSNFSVDSCVCASNACTLKVTPNANVSSTTAYTLYYRVGSAGSYANYNSYSVNVTPVNDAPTLSALVAQTILENSSAAPSSGYLDVSVAPGGGGFETSQVLSLALSSANTTLLPNTKCQNYTPGSGSPISSVTPSASGVYYFDALNFKCYVSTGTTNTSWALYPSLTAYPKCAYDYYGQGAPAISPGASGKHYLDTRNNLCYKSSSTTVASWALDSTLTDFYIAYVPTANQSGSSVITVTLTDDGGTSNGGVNTAASSFTLNVTAVNDPPYFLSSITKVDTNEGGMVVAGPFKVDEDQGSSTDEDAQSMSVTSFTSDNTSVLPTSAISIFYDLNDNGVEDSGESRALAATLENAGTDDSKLHNFYLKLKPIAGISGNANVTMTVSDGTNSISTTFSLIVHAVSAGHGGWTNIVAKGIKTDKSGAPAASADVQCSYNKSTDYKSCNSQNCTGSDSPNAVIVPDEAGVLYYDSANKRCYRSTGTSIYSWVDFNTTCPVTRLSGAENMIAASAPTPSAVGQYYYDTVAKQCYISTGTTVGSWIAYSPSKITLSWNSFTVSGSGADSSVQIYGWNVYRREAGYDYDYINGFLKPTSSSTMTISDPTIRTYTDTTAVAGKVYYYLVRPVDSTSRHLTISTPEIDSEVRILAPTQNYAFVHRWMVNQEVCNSMHMTTQTTNKVDTENNYRCPYSGPGETSGFYDIGKDMLVDISETGCPYTASPSCSANGCIGRGNPTTLGVSGMSTNDIYYDRSAGACYIYDGVAWKDYNSAGAALIAAASTKVNTALNAPLTNLSQAQASLVCTNRTIGSTLASALSGSTPLVSGTGLALPSKKEYIAYSAAPFGMSDSNITDLEEGYSLNVQSRCNSSNANGIDSAFSNSDIPPTSFIYSIPGTASSGIRSLYTGSVPWGSNFSTETCSSRYGVQDVYGNVAEWVKDKMTCDVALSTTLSADIVDNVVTTITVASTTGLAHVRTITINSEVMGISSIVNGTTLTVTRGAAGTTAIAHANGVTVYPSESYTCTAVAGASGVATDLGRYDFLTGTYLNSPTYSYAFDLITGPYNDSSADSMASQGDGFLTNWDFKDELYNAGKFSFPLGMPINNDIATSNSSVLASSAALSNLLSIGLTAGITSDQLHGDGIIVNGSSVNNSSSNPTQTGSFAQGGSYLSGSRSGRYSSELIPDASVRSDVGFRCYLPIDKTNYPADTGRHTYSY